MAEILFKAIDANHSDPIKDLRGCYKIGYPVVVMPDDHEWGNEERLPKFVIIKCPEVTVEQCQQYIESWKDDFVYTVVSQKAVQGIYTVRVQNDSVSVSGLNNITLDKVENYLLNWNCNNISFTFPYVQFDFILWQVVQSDGFWGKENIDDYASFELDSYDSETGVGIISATVYNIDELIVLDKIQFNGGVLISHIGDVYQFSIEKSTIFNKFKEEVKKRTELTYCRRKFYISVSNVQLIINSGGVITLTKTQLLNLIKNKFDD